MPNNHNTDLNIIALGRSDLLYDSISSVLERGYKIRLIITSKHTQYQYKRDADDFRKIAERNGIDFTLKERIDDESSIDLIKSYNPDIGISVNWKTIIPSKVLSLFRIGILNAHPGKLPRYKGNSARNWALVNGEESFSQTIYLMDTDLDSGDILIQKDFPINSKTNIGEMYKITAEVTPDMFCQAIKMATSSNPKFIKRVESKPLRGFPRMEVDSEIEWNKSAKNIDRVIRASSGPFSGAFTFHEGRKITIWKSNVEHPTFDYLASPGQVVEIRKEEGTVVVATGDGFLVVELISIDDTEEIKPTEYVKTLRTRFGISAGIEIYKMQKSLDSILKILKDKKVVK